MALRRLLIGIIGKIRGQRALDRYRHKIQFIEIPTLEYPLIYTIRTIILLSVPSRYLELK